MKYLQLIIIFLCVVSSSLALPPIAFQDQLKMANRADLIAYEGFSSAEYTVGNHINGINGGSGWTAWTAPADAAKVKADSPGLTYTGLPDTGNCVYGINNSGGDPGVWQATRGISGSPFGTTPGTVWVSFIANFGGNAYWPRSSLYLRDGSTKKVGVGNFGSDMGGDVPRLALSVDGTTSTPSPAISPIQRFFLLSIDFTAGNDPVSLWVDPNISLGESGLGTPQASVTDKDFVFDNLLLEFGFGGARVDEIRLATTWIEAVGR